MRISAKKRRKINIEKGKLHIKDSEVSKIYLPEAAVVLDDSGEKHRKVDGKLNPDVFQSLVISRTNLYRTWKN